MNDPVEEWRDKQEHCRSRGGGCEDPDQSIVWLCLKNFKDSVAGTGLKKILKRTSRT